MAGLGCGCGCKGSSAENFPPIGSTGRFGFPMAPDGVPISLDLPGYEAVTGTIPGFNAPIDGAAAPGGASALDSVNAVAMRPVLGCPLWVWVVAAGLVMWERGTR